MVSLLTYYSYSYLWNVDMTRDMQPKYGKDGCYISNITISGSVMEI